MGARVTIEDPDSGAAVRVTQNGLVVDFGSQLTLTGPVTLQAGAEFNLANAALTHTADVAADGSVLARLTDAAAAHTLGIDASGRPTVKVATLPAGLAQDGTDVTGSTMPSGGDGIRGWLSALYTNGISVPQAVSEGKQSPLALTSLCSAVTDTTPSAGLDVSGYDRIQVEAVATGTVAAQAVTFAVQGSYDGTHWYAAGIQQIDGVTTPARAVSATITPGNGTIRHVYKVLDDYAQLRIAPSANTLVTGLDCNLYAVPV